MDAWLEEWVDEWDEGYERLKRERTERRIAITRLLSYLTWKGRP